MATNGGREGERPTVTTAGLGPRTHRELGSTGKGTVAMPSHPAGDRYPYFAPFRIGQTDFQMILGYEPRPLRPSENPRTHVESAELRDKLGTVLDAVEERGFAIGNEFTREYGNNAGPFRSNVQADHRIIGIGKFGEGHKASETLVMVAPQEGQEDLFKAAAELVEGLSQDPELTARVYGMKVAQQDWKKRTSLRNTVVTPLVVLDSPEMRTDAKAGDQKRTDRIIFALYKPSELTAKGEEESAQWKRVLGIKEDPQKKLDPELETMLAAASSLNYETFVAGTAMQEKTPPAIKKYGKVVEGAEGESLGEVVVPQGRDERYLNDKRSGGNAGWYTRLPAEDGSVYFMSRDTRGGVHTAVHMTQEDSGEKWLFGRWGSKRRQLYTPIEGTVATKTVTGDDGKEHTLLVAREPNVHRRNYRWVTDASHHTWMGGDKDGPTERYVSWNGRTAIERDQQGIRLRRSGHVTRYPADSEMVVHTTNNPFGGTRTDVTVTTPAKGKKK